MVKKGNTKIARVKREGLPQDAQQGIRLIGSYSRKSNVVISTIFQLLRRTFLWYRKGHQAQETNHLMNHFQPMSNWVWSHRDLE